jgi:hypothetical protein
MTQEEKDLLLKDLCARLSYGVKAYIKNWSKLDQKYYEGVYTVKSAFPSLNEVHVQSKTGSVDVILGHTDYVIKPYLFPLSSMTEEQRLEYDKMSELDIEYTITQIKNDSLIWTTGLNRFNWFLKNHFDIYGLIPMDLAIDATDKNIYNH